MAGSDSSAYLAAVKWGDEGYYLQEFTHKFTLPQVARIIKGHYMSLGVPSLPSPSLNQIVFLASGGKRVKVAAQCVKFKDGRRVVPVGSKLSIPDNYDGWFEILSEDGRAVRCIESVAELHKRLPESCLVRESIKVHLAKSDSPDSISEKTRTIPAGDTLFLDGEVHSMSGRSKSRYLRCLTSKKETVFMSLDQRGKFSPIAGEDSISGVHTIKNLLSKRFPLMVRLVHGKPPTSLKSNSHFVNEMRLYSLFEEESIVALPLLKDSNIVTLSPSAPLKVQAPKNVETLLKLEEYTALAEKCKNLMGEVSDRIQVFDISLSKEFRLEPKQAPGLAHLRLKNLPYIQRVRRSISDPYDRLNENLKPEPDSTSKETKKHNLKEDNYDEIDQIYDYVRGFAPLPQKIKNDLQSETALNGDPSFGSSPPNPATTSPQVDSVEESIKQVSEPKKPEPPPVETIPARRMSIESSARELQQNVSINNLNKIASKTVEPVYKEVDHIYEKVGKRCHTKTSEIPVRVPMRSNSSGKIFLPNMPSYGVNKMFIKSPAQQRIPHKSRFFKHSKSSPALKDAPIQKVTYRARSNRSKSLTTSPLFNIRYKSLTNLAIDFNTLDSSNSGGQTSSGSGGSKEFKDIVFRSRKLPRPKSLTNLFCELNQVDCQNRYNLIQSDLTKGMENRKVIFTHEGANGKLLIGNHNKRIGTLYL